PRLALPHSLTQRTFSMSRAVTWRLLGAGGGLLAVALAVVPWTPASPPSLRYQKRRAAGVPVHLITVNLNDPNVKVAVALAQGGRGGGGRSRGELHRTPPRTAPTRDVFSKPGASA